MWKEVEETCGPPTRYLFLADVHPSGLPGILQYLLSTTP